MLPAAVPTESARRMMSPGNPISEQEGDNEDKL